MTRGGCLPWPIRLAAAALSTVLIACESSPPPSTRTITVWRPLGAWSGRGLQQTDPFISDTGMLRVVWNARNETPDTEGTLRVSLHSAVSGRPLLVAVDHRGAGHDTAYVSEDPRQFYLVIEAANVEWSVEVAEGIPATETGPTTGRAP